MNRKSENKKYSLYTLLRWIAGVMAAVMIFACLNGCTKKDDESTQNGTVNENITETDNTEEQTSSGLTSEGEIIVDPYNENNTSEGSGNNQNSESSGGSQSGSSSEGSAQGDNSGSNQNTGEGGSDTSGETGGEDQNPESGEDQNTDEEDGGEAIGHF